jgi:hypothetical protein
MARVLLTSLHRTADSSQPHGFLIEIDWDQKRVTNKIAAPPLWSEFGERNRGGRRGLRGITYYNGLIWVASCDCLIGFTPEGLQPERMISHPYMSHIHEIEGREDGIWVTSTNGNGIFQINERQEIVREGWLEGPPTVDMRVYMEHHYDRFHVNTVAFDNGNVLAYSATNGKVYKMWPGPVTEVIQLERRCHNVAPTKFGWIRNVSGKAMVKVGDDEIPTPIHGTATELAKPGWLRGMAWLTDTRILVGSSPATLIEIDVPARQVVDEMRLEDDVEWTTHGIYVDNRRCSEKTAGTGEPADAQKIDRSERPRGVRKLLKQLGL